MANKKVIVQSRGLLAKGAIGKGKRKWVCKAKKKPLSVMLQYVKLNLEKSKRGGRRGDNSIEASSSSLEDCEVGKSLFLDSIKARGECSGNRSILDMPKSRIVEASRPKKVLFNHTLESPSRQKTQSRENMDICVDLGQMEVCPSNEKSSQRSFKSSEGNGQAIGVDFSSVQEEVATIAVEKHFLEVVNVDNDSSDMELISSDDWVAKEKVDICVDSGSLVKSPVAGRSSEGEKKVQATDDAEVFSNVKATSAVKERTGTIHGLRQNSRSKSKVSSSYGMRTRNSIESGSVEEKAAKTVEMGIALGFDFSEVEDKVLEEITRRGNEDIARFEAIFG